MASVEEKERRTTRKIQLRTIKTSFLHIQKPKKEKETVSEKGRQLETRSQQKGIQQAVRQLRGTQQSKHGYTTQKQR